MPKRQKIVTRTITCVVPYTDLKSGNAAIQALIHIANRDALMDLAESFEIEIEFGPIVEGKTRPVP